LELYRLSFSNKVVNPLARLHRKSQLYSLLTEWELADESHANDPCFRMDSSGNSPNSTIAGLNNRPEILA
jgi:hypothetical protein